MEPPSPPAWPPPPEAPSTEVRAWPVLRDILIIFGMTFAFGLTIGVMTGLTHVKVPPAAFGLMNLVVVVAGFVISGCLAPPARWPHLALVALGLWLSSLINVMFFGAALTQWMMALPLIFICMGVGGGLSFAFKRAA